MKSKSENPAALGLDLLLALSRSSYAQQKIDIQGFYPGMTWTASQQKESERNLKCAPDPYLTAIPQTDVGTMGSKRCAGPSDEFRFVFTLLIKGQDDTPLLWKIIYKFYTAASPDELVSSISGSYSSKPSQLTEDDVQTIRGMVDLGFRAVRAWKLTDETFLALSLVNLTYYPGVQPWTLALWRRDLLLKHRDIIATKRREMYPLPKLD